MVSLKMGVPWLSKSVIPIEADKCRHTVQIAQLVVNRLAGNVTHHNQARTRSHTDQTVTARQTVQWQTNTVAYQSPTTTNPTQEYQLLMGPGGGLGLLFTPILSKSSVTTFGLCMRAQHSFTTLDC